MSTSDSGVDGQGPQGPQGPALEIPAAGAMPKQRKVLLVVVVVAVLVIAAIAVWAIIYLGSGSLTVSTTTSFVAAGNSTSFLATITAPTFVSAGPVNWQFGDGVRADASSASVAHTYAIPGTFYVAASSTLSNGKTVDNSMALFPMQVGPAPIKIPRTYGEPSALGTLTVNKTASATGAPLIAVGGSIRFHASIQVAPKFS